MKAKVSKTSRLICDFYVEETGIFWDKQVFKMTLEQLKLLMSKDQKWANGINQYILENQTVVDDPLNYTIAVRFKSKEPNTFNGYLFTPKYQC